MRIVQFLHGNALGGMEIFCVDLSNALAKEHEVMLLADPVFKRYCNKNIIFIPLDIEKSKNNPWLLFKIYKQIKTFKADIIHAHKQNSIQILKRISPFLKVPYVATKHDTQRKKVFLGLKYVIAISEETGETIQSEYLFKIYNGIPYEQAHTIVLPKTFNIVAVGGLRKVKGFDILIESMLKLSFDFHLTIIGEGEERQSLERLIKTLGLEEKVSLLGFKNNVKDYLYSSDLQVISSYSEGFSLAMVEGIFYAPVLISTEVSGSKDILSDTLLYKQKDIVEKLNEVHENYATYKKVFNETKRVYQETLTIEHSMHEHVKVYNTIIDNEN